MSKVSLITGGLEYSGLLENKLISEKGKLIRLIESNSYNEEHGNSQTEEKNLIDIKWNKRSPLSARNTILTAINEFDHIDDAILIYQPGISNRTFHEASSSLYDLQVDRWIKGYGYMFKELIQLFIKQGAGNIFLCLDTGGHSLVSPVESSIYEFLKCLILKLSLIYQNEPFKIYCFEAETVKREDFITFFDKTVSNSKYVAGKVYRYSDKKSIFNFSKN